MRDYLESNSVKRRVSASKKRANNFARQREIMDAYDLYYGYYRDYDEIDKYDVNYDLFNGRLDVSMYDDAVAFNIDNEQVKLESSTAITHYPLISQLANEIHGEMINRPFKPHVKDISLNGKNLRMKKWNELLMEFINNTIIGPLQQEATQKFFLANGITDPFSLNPEQQNQAQAEIQKMTQEMMPEDMLDFMTNDFQTPTQRQAQQLLEWFIERNNLKALFDEGYKHAIAVAKEVYYIGDRHDHPFVEFINPKFFTFGPASNSDWIQDGIWAKYEEWLSYEEVTQRYAEELRMKDLKELESLFEPIGGFRLDQRDPYKPDQVKERAMHELGREGSFLHDKYRHVNYKTREGQKDILRLYEDVINKYGPKYGYNYSNYGVRVARLAWRDKRLLKRVTRIENGKEKKYWLSEHYEPRPEDVKVVEVWVDEIWEGDKIGTATETCIYTNIRPIPGQYRSIDDPFDTKLPYIGKLYNTHLGNSKNVSLVDLGKPWQKEFDTTMAQLKHDMSTDLGNVFLLTLSLKPEGMTWQNFLDTVKNSNLMLVDYHKRGINNIDPQLLRSINLSKAPDIANKVQLLDYFRNNLIMSMRSNQNRIGAVGQYATNENIKMNTAAAYNQTENYFDTHRQITEKVMNALLNRAKYVYKQNPEKLSHILDDMAAADLELSAPFWYSTFNVKVTTSTEDIRKMEELRGQVLSFIQNGMSFDGVLALSLADTPSEIKDVLKKETARIEKQRQEQMAHEQQIQQQQIQAQMAEKQKEMELELTMHREKLASQERRTEIDVQKFRLQNDVDQNQISDFIEKAILEMQQKQQQHESQLEYDRQQQEIDKEHKDKELELEEKEINLKYGVGTKDTEENS